MEVVASAVAVLEVVQVEVSVVVQVVDSLVDLEDSVVQDSVDQLLYKNIFMYMSHHQNKKNSMHQDQFQLPKLKNTIKLSSSKPHPHHLTKHQLSQFNHKTKKKHWYMF